MPRVKSGITPVMWEGAMEMGDSFVAAGITAIAIGLAASAMLLGPRSDVATVRAVQFLVLGGSASVSVGLGLMAVGCFR